MMIVDCWPCLALPCLAPKVANETRLRDKGPSFTPWQLRKARVKLSKPCPTSARANHIPFLAFWQPHLSQADPFICMFARLQSYSFHARETCHSTHSRVIKPFDMDPSAKKCEPPGHPGDISREEAELGILPSHGKR